MTAIDLLHLLQEVLGEDSSKNALEVRFEVDGEQYDIFEVAERDGWIGLR